MSNIIANKYHQETAIYYLQLILLVQDVKLMVNPLIYYSAFHKIPLNNEFVLNELLRSNVLR